MALDTPAPRTRRAVLAAAIGGLGALVAQAFGRPAEVLAGSDGDVVLGAANTAVSTTKVTDTTAGHSAVWGNAPAITGVGVGVRGDTASEGYGVWGNATAGLAAGVRGDNYSSYGYGVHGKAANSGHGVFGESPNFAIYGRASSAAGQTRGIMGFAVSPEGTGVLGETLAATGVMGLSGADFTTTVVKTGVYGYAAQDSSARGVHGKSTSGQGIRGEATSGIGVKAVASSSGVALSVTGRATFNRSGRVSVPINAKYVDVTVSGGLASSANVLAMLQRYRSGVYVAAVRTNYPSSGKARIYLNKVASTTTTTPVAWFVLS